MTIHEQNNYKGIIKPAVQRCSVKKVFLEIWQNSDTGKHLSQSLLFFNKVAGPMCFPVNFAKFLRTPLFIEHLRWLLLALYLKHLKEDK